MKFKGNRGKTNLGIEFNGKDKRNTFSAITTF